MTTDNLTPEEIREGNRIVAEYMGAAFETGQSGTVYCEYPNGDYHPLGCDFYFGNWEKMIPAWAKVQEEMQYIISNSTYYTATKQRADFYEAINDDNNPSAFRTLVAAIKLLNEKTK